MGKKARVSRSWVASKDGEADRSRSLCSIQKHLCSYRQESYVISHLFFFGLFRAIPMACGGSQARGQIGAIAVSLNYSHSNTRCELRL